MITGTVVLRSLFSVEADLEITLTEPHYGDLWLETVGYDENEEFVTGGSVRLRSYFGGGRQEGASAGVQAMAGHSNFGCDHQLTFGHALKKLHFNLDKAEKRFITCDDERGNYAELFRFRNGIHGIRTISETNKAKGPIVWVSPDRKLPMTHEQAAFRSLFQKAYKIRPANNFGSSR